MPQQQIVKGFSKLSRIEKLAWLSSQATRSGHTLTERTLTVLENHLHPDPDLQEIYSDISENTVSNYFLPLGLAPNFLINGSLHVVPMVIEESSVVAAASSAAKFWAMHGGFSSRVMGTTKAGQVHFTWNGREDELRKLFRRIEPVLHDAIRPLTSRMKSRGGGVDSLELRKGNPAIPGHYFLFVTFSTADAMGANFINSVLESISRELISEAGAPGTSGSLEPVMSILSNYTPDCKVQCRVEGETAIFSLLFPGMTGDQFAAKFKLAVDIASEDIYRAVTHNKGIFNGMDAVILATGNDFRAVEACGHAYASRDGRYRSLSTMDLSEGSFRFSLEVPMAVGTVGGLTKNHPVASAALDILGNPDAESLMEIIAAAGLANNFSAIRSLVTTGIQKGHMKMHLGNILRQLDASPPEAEMASRHFRDSTVSHSAVAAYLEQIRNKHKKE